MCNKSFAHKETLVRHLLIHPKEDAHKCNLCDKEFKLKGQLSVHFSERTGDTSYTTVANVTRLKGKQALY